ILIFGASFFYLVSEKNFFKTCRYIAKKGEAFFFIIKEADYSSLKNVNLNSITTWFKSSADSLLAKFRKEEPVSVTPAKLKITESFKEKPSQPKPLSEILPQIEIDEE